MQWIQIKTERSLSTNFKDSLWECMLVGHGGGEVAVVTELAAHADAVTGVKQGDSSISNYGAAFAAKNAFTNGEDVHKANQLAVQEVTGKIFGLLPTISAKEASGKEGTKAESDNNPDTSTRVVSKRVLIRKLTCDSKIRAVVEDCPQLRVLHNESSYAAGLILLKTRTEDHISRRELCQFVCGLIAGQIGVSRRVDQARQFQKRIKDQLERLYTQLGMPDGKRLVGRRFLACRVNLFARARGFCYVNRHR